MDPNEALRCVRHYVTEYRKAVDDGDDAQAVMAADSIASHFDALDDWILCGGFLPSDWSRQ